MKKIISMLLLLAVTTVYANQIDVSKLTTEQQAQIAKQVTALSDTPTNVSATVRKETEAWGEMGANMGKAMVGAAKEIGIAANEFSQTSLGKVVVFIVTYKIIGKDVLRVILGMTVLLFGYSLALWMLLTRRWSDVTYEYEPAFWGLYKRARITKSSTDEGVVVSKLIAGALLLAISTLIGFGTILN